jgi:hypothetical protein
LFIELCINGDIHSSNFVADESCIQEQILDRIVHVGNFKFENASGSAASSAAACTISVIMTDELS